MEKLHHLVENHPFFSAVIFSAFGLICLGIQWWFFDRNKR